MRESISFGITLSEGMSAYLINYSFNYHFCCTHRPMHLDSKADLNETSHASLDF